MNTAAAAALAVMAIVHQFVDGFNAGDTKKGLAACASPAYIVDEFPPHEWTGENACAKWAADYDANAKANGITDGVVTLSTPLHVDVDGDHAYVVVPATYAYKQRGKPVKETGSLFTVVLAKSEAGWRITAWTWGER
ncbi:MAG: nuclear transport factor 2 family protein [Candidatus Eremiobacteraeota bacterium]|nr:nuclear transport factor 2 family protein [Candidatus Eremiobacteraeota bacterium]